MAPERLNSTFAALADPTRRAILARLASGEASVTELAKPFAMSLPAVSKHLKVLERAGLIARGREAQWRPCRLDAGPLKDVADWVDDYRASGSSASNGWTTIYGNCNERSGSMAKLDLIAEPGKQEIIGAM
jgi:DNA-binding transcriptional ArsR family regulator